MTFGPEYISNFQILSDSWASCAEIADWNELVFGIRALFDHVYKVMWCLSPKIMGTSE